ncbi:MAG: cell division protein ZapA [Burkholderiales bacterium]|nr:cell division protein ZapA [Burkholderiales bacterium]
MDTLDVKIMGREFRLACTTEEKPQLLRAIGVVDTRMENIRQGGKAMGVDRIAMLAALQIAHDTIREQGEQKNSVMGLDSEVLERKIQSIASAIDSALEATGPINDSLF